MNPAHKKRNKAGKFSVRVVDDDKPPIEAPTLSHAERLLRRTDYRSIQYKPAGSFDWVDLKPANIEKIRCLEQTQRRLSDGNHP